jgi:hypothetical protein
MKQHTLAPAVLASITAAGLVLMPVTAFAQDTDEPSLRVEQSAEPTDDATEASAPQKAEDQKKDSEAAATPEAEPTEEPEESGDEPTSTPEDPQDDESDSTDDADDSDDADEDADDDESEDEEATDENAAVSVADVALSEIADVDGEEAPAGAQISVTGLLPDTAYTLTVDGGPESSDDQTLNADADGTAAETYTIELPDDADPASYAGQRTVTVTDADGDEVASGTFQVTDDTTEDEAPEADPQLDVPSSIQVDDVMVPAGEEPGDRGLPVAATGLDPEGDYTFRVVAPAENSDLDAEWDAEVGPEGTASGTYYIEWTGDYLADAIAGTYRVELVDGEDEVVDQADVEFTVDAQDDDEEGDDEDDQGDDEGTGGEDEGDQDDNADDASVDPSVSISPQKLSATAFMDYERGVQVTALDCAPGEAVGLEVLWPGTDEVAYTDGATADDDGAAGFSFYGTGDRASDYVGTWTVRITCAGETVSDTFTVTGPSSDNGHGGSELPRTGSESGILGIVAAGLMTVGAATVMISSRPRRSTTA